MKKAHVALGILGLGAICLLLSFRSQLSPVAKRVFSDSAGKTTFVAPRTTVAKVNSVQITAGELEEEVSRLLPPSGSHGKVDPQKRKQVRQMALEQLIVRELAYQRGKALRLEVEPEVREATIRKIRARYKTENSFREALRADEITEPEFIHRVEKDLLLRNIYKTEIDDKAAVSDSEVRQFYDQNKAKFLRPESIHLRQIVMKAIPGNGSNAEKKIYEVFDKLKAGEPFDTLAYQYSEDDYRVMGGDNGWIHRGQLAPELEKAAFAAKPKTLTGPFQTSFGWHLLRMEERQTQRQLKFQEAREDIAASLRQKRLRQRKSEFVRELKEGARIEYPRSL